MEVHPEKTYEMGLSVSYTRRVCGFNKQGACLNHDVDEFVKQSEIIEVETLTTSTEHTSRNNGETHFTSDFRRRSTETRFICQKHVWNSGRFTHLGTLAVRIASVESTCLFLRKTNASSVVNKHSAALFYSPNEDGKGSQKNGNAG